MTQGTETSPARRGLRCQKCGGRLTVLATKRPCDGTVRRYRACPACGIRWTTEERFASAGREGNVVA